MVNLVTKLVRRLYRLAFIRYMLCGAIATVIDLSILYILTDFGGLWYILSATISFIAAASANFLLNRKFTFRSNSNRVKRQYGLFVSFAAIGLFMNIGIMYGLVELFDLWYIFAKFIATFIVFVFNYGFNKKITFAV